MNAFVLLLALLTFSATAAEIYLDDGRVIALPVGSKVYVDDGTVWTFTRFNEGGFDIRPLTPLVEITEVCPQSGLTFGGSSGSCVVEEVVTEETEESCDGLTFGGSGC